MSGDGERADVPGSTWYQGPYTIPPVTTPTIADVLIAHKVSWAYYGEGWNAYLSDPDAYSGGGSVLQHLQPVPV